MKQPYPSSNHLSYWLGTTPTTSYEPLDGELEVDVAIVGGGIAGLTAALLLTEAGNKVAVVERHRIATGVTGFTTAKLTSQHGLVYKELVGRFGEERARIYADANQTAIDRVISLAKEQKIECDIQRLPGYVYATDEDGRKQVKEEVEAAKKLGLPASYTEDVPLPFETSGAVRFEDQAIFHPRKYLLAIAEALVKSGGLIFEQTAAIKIEDNDYGGCTVTCDKGKIRARDVIIATNYPIKDPRLFFARLTTEHSYAIAAKLEKPFPHGIFYSTEECAHSLRPHLVGTPDEVVIIGGEEHVAGQGGDTTKRYGRLEDWARRHFEVHSVDYTWSTHDAVTFDSVPMIGRLTSGTKHLYVATGFNAWGMSHSMVAAMILSDEIQGRENSWSQLYNPSRISSFLSTEMLSYDVSSVTTLIRDKFASFPESIADLALGEARVVEVDGEKMAVYKDKEGQIHSVSAVCTHMGCIVNWNNAEMTWDCPCHGSRFNIDGGVIQAPAIDDLKSYTER